MALEFASPLRIEQTLDHPWHFPHRPKKVSAPAPAMEQRPTTWCQWHPERRGPPLETPIPSVPSDGVLGANRSLFNAGTTTPDPIPRHTSPQFPECLAAVSHCEPAPLTNRTGQQLTHSTCRAHDVPVKTGVVRCQMRLVRVDRGEVRVSICSVSSTPPPPLLYFPARCCRLPFVPAWCTLPVVSPTPCRFEHP